MKKISFASNEPVAVGQLIRYDMGIYKVTKVEPQGPYFKAYARYVGSAMTSIGSR